MTCSTEVDTCVIRGDIWSMDVGLTDAWSEVVADPGGYVGTIVFREDQDDDSSPALLTLTTVPQTTGDPTPNAPPLYMGFDATSGETQQLPYYDLVGYCEIAPLAALDQSRRLFNMRIKIND